MLRAILPASSLGKLSSSFSTRNQLWNNSHPLLIHLIHLIQILLANSTFVRMFYLFPSTKGGRYSHWKRKTASFSGIFPHFLNSPAVSVTGERKSCSGFLPSIKKRPSLLKNSIAGLYEEEKHGKSPSYETYSQKFGSKTWYFAFLKTHQLSFSTGWEVFR